VEQGRPVVGRDGLKTRVSTIKIQHKVFLFSGLTKSYRGCCEEECRTSPTEQCAAFLVSCLGEQGPLDSPLRLQPPGTQRSHQGEAGRPRVKNLCWVTKRQQHCAETRHREDAPGWRHDTCGSLPGWSWGLLCWWVSKMWPCV